MPIKYKKTYRKKGKGVVKKAIKYVKKNLNNLNDFLKKKQYAKQIMGPLDENGAISYGSHALGLNKYLNNNIAGIPFKFAANLGYGKRRKTRRGNGAFSWLKDKATGVNNYLKEKKFIHKIRDVPILGGALNLGGIPGMAAWGLDKLGYGVKSRIRRQKTNKERIQKIKNTSGIVHVKSHTVKAHTIPGYTVKEHTIPGYTVKAHTRRIPKIKTVTE